MGTTRRAIAVTEQQDQWLKASDRAWEIYERQRIYQRSEPLQTSDIEGHQSGRIGSTSNSLSRQELYGCRSRLTTAPTSIPVPSVGIRFFTLQLRQSATHDSSHETAEIECKSDDPDKKRAIQIHPSWFVNEIVF